MAETVFDAYGLLKKFYGLEAERAYTYRIFEEGHKIYLSTAPDYDFNRFRKLVLEVTQEFKGVSQDVIVLEKRLRTEFNLPQLADILLQLQEDEKLKLELTVQLHLAKQNVIDQPKYAEGPTEVKEFKKRLSDVIERINDHMTTLQYAMVDL